MTEKDIRQGRLEFADYDGNKHTVIWIVGVDCNGKIDKRMFIRKTDIWTLMIRIDDELSAWFEKGRWKKRPSILGNPRRLYRMLLALYS